MGKGRLKARLSLRREALRFGVLSKRAGYILLCNLTAIILLGSLLLFLVERKGNPNISSYWDALYMVFITIATVGYGDVTPVTAAGRLIVIVIIVFGVASLSAFITLLATRRAEKARRRYAGLQDKIKSGDHVVVCGWNGLARFVIRRLEEELKRDFVPIVLLCEQEESPVEDDYIFFLRGSPTSDVDLRRANVAGARMVVLLADESRGGCGADIDARTVLAALNVRKVNPQAKIVAEALETENVQHLELAGAGEILDTNFFLGNLIARSALHYGLINTLTDVVAREAGTRVYTVPAGPETLGRTRRDIGERMHREHGAHLLSIFNAQGFVPDDDDYLLAEGDKMLVIAEKPPPGATT